MKKISIKNNYEARTLLLNDVSMSDRCRHSYDIRRTLIGEVFNSKNIC